MNNETIIYQFNPVLRRFTDIRDLWLGAANNSTKARSKRRPSPFVLWHTQLIKKAKTITKKIAHKTLHGALNAVIGIAIIASVVMFGPRLFAMVFSPSEQQAQAEELSGNFDLTVDEARLADRPELSPSERNYKPPYNENLPEGDWLIVPRIGVRSALEPTENYEEALKTGLWLVPDFGRPGERELPIIIAGHRFGFKWWWQSDYWRYHSFYLLPDLEEGDTVEIISEKRKYVYEIYATDEGTEITDYDADLILYTCKHLSSDIRVFRYAKLDRSQQETPLGIL